MGFALWRRSAERLGVRIMFEVKFREFSFVLGSRGCTLGRALLDSSGKFVVVKKFLYRCEREKYRRDRQEKFQLIYYVLGRRFRP